MLCFRKFPLAKKFMDKSGGRGLSKFSFSIFCPTVPKDFVGEPFCAVFQTISGSQKVFE